MFSHMFLLQTFLSPKSFFKGEGGGVPWVQIMENEFEYLADRGDHDSHLAEKFLKKYYF